MLDAGFGLLAERPIDAIPIDEIVAAAKVGKGSFFNHFDDKQGFANAVAADIRQDIERRVELANRNVIDPLERLVGGLSVGIQFALSDPKRTKVMLWSLGGGGASQAHPLNQGLRDDLGACVSAGLLNPDAEAAGVMFWLGVCQMSMISALSEGLSRAAVAEHVRDLLILALRGMGADPSTTALLAAKVAADIQREGDRAT
jgi:AcrR family transcriptional regulator